MNGLLGDIRYGARMLVKRPGLSALGIVALALGIGLTTTMFSIVYAAVLRGLPYERSDRLVAHFPQPPSPGHSVHAREHPRLHRLARASRRASRAWPPITRRPST